MTQKFKVGDHVSVNLASGELFGQVYIITDGQALVDYINDDGLPDSELFDLDLLIRR